MRSGQSSESKRWIGCAVRLIAANVRDAQTGQLVPVWTRGTVRQAAYSPATGRQLLVVAWDCGVTCPVHSEDIEVLENEECDRV